MSSYFFQAKSNIKGNLAFINDNFSKKQKMNYKKKSDKEKFLEFLDEINEDHPEQWRWFECPYFIKNIAEPNVFILRSLDPIKKSPEENQSKNLEITLEKPLNFNNTFGWNWHKSWTLPDIYVNFPEAKNYQKKKFVQLYVAKVGLDCWENFFLVELPVKGVNRHELFGQNLILSNLKFGNTSYSNEGLKFHLIISILEELDEENPNNTLERYRVLDSKISPPIYVDSRKGAMNSKNSDSKSISLFNPQLLTKNFIKKRGLSEEKKEEIVKNSIKGFIHYYTAPNIRNKINHPIFIALRFSTCISLFYNKKIFCKEILAENIREIISFIQHYSVSISKIPSKQKKSKIFLDKHYASAENSYLILLIKSLDFNEKAVSKKVSEFLGSFDKRIIRIFLEEKSIPDHYEEVIDLNLLKKVYLEEYKSYEQKSQNKSNYRVKNKGNGIDLSEDCIEELNNNNLNNELQEDKNEVHVTECCIPEITTLININELCQEQNKKKNVMKTNPEKLFEIKSGNIKKKKKKMQKAEFLHKQNSKKRLIKGFISQIPSEESINESFYSENKIKKEMEIEKDEKIKHQGDENNKKGNNEVQNNNNNDDNPFNQQIPRLPSFFDFFQQMNFMNYLHSYTYMDYLASIERMHKI